MHGERLLPHTCSVMYRRFPDDSALARVLSRIVGIRLPEHLRRLRPGISGSAGQRHGRTVIA